jgi:paraquat-inducible protein B
MSKKSDRPAKHHVVSIAKFATGKAAFNLKRKEVEEQKRNQKSKVLREYAKLCKSEGIVSDRVNLESHQKGQKHIKDQESKSKSNPILIKDPNPFKDACNEANEKALEKTKAIEIAKEKQIEIKRKNDLREVKRKERMKRTKKGQPILYNQITSILGKLQGKPDI